MGLFSDELNSYRDPNRLRREQAEKAARAARRQNIINSAFDSYNSLLQARETATMISYNRNQNTLANREFMQADQLRYKAEMMEEKVIYVVKKYNLQLHRKDLDFKDEISLSYSESRELERKKKKEREAYEMRKTSEYYRAENEKYELTQQVIEKVHEIQNLYKKADELEKKANDRLNNSFFF